MKKQLAALVEFGKVAVAALVVAVGLFLRFGYLQQIPVGLYHDEMDYVFTGEAVARYGTDITGHWSPWQLRPLQTLNYTAELTPLWHALVQLVFGLGPQSAHLPAALFGVATAVLAAWLVWVLFEDANLALAGFLYVLVNPWHIHISRMGYEASIALFFQVVVVLAALVLVTKPTKTLIAQSAIFFAAVVALLAGFFTYHATKFTLPVLILVVLVWAVACKRLKNGGQIVAMGLLVVVSFGLLAMAVVNQKSGEFGNRASELWLEPAKLSQMVDQARQQSLTLLASKVVFNKLTFGIDAAIRHYFAVFDPYRLLVSGYEGGFQFSLVVHGFFYLSYVVLIPLGVYGTWQKNKQRALLLLLLLVVSPVASTVTVSYQAIFRSAFTYLLLTLYAGIGVWTLVAYLKRQQLVVASVGLVLVALLVVGEPVWFGAQYFSRYPILSADNHYFFERVMAEYLARTQQPTVVVVEGDAFSKARAIVAYQQLMPTLSDSQKQQFSKPSLSTFDLGKFQVTTDCPPLDAGLYKQYLVEENKLESCRYKQYLATESSQLLVTRPPQPATGPTANLGYTIKSLASPIDSRSYFMVLGDTLCSEYELPKYILPRKLSDFNVSSLDTQHFCQTWLKAEYVN
jgi:4-amino-4-deoxy-L-arabinose transferase-like glycosyltransferase